MAEEEKPEEKVEEIELNIKRTEIPVFVEPEVTRIQYALFSYLFELVFLLLFC